MRSLQRVREFASSQETYIYGLRFVHRDSHSGLFLYYRCRAVAERQRGRHLRGIRRSGEPDGFWPTRSDQCSVQSHNLVGSNVHDHFDHASGICQQARRTNIRPARNQDATCEDATGSHAGPGEEVTSTVTLQKSSGALSVCIDCSRSCAAFDVFPLSISTVSSVIVFGQRRMYHP
jgi:hypothetical protein